MNEKDLECPCCHEALLDKDLLPLLKTLEKQIGHDLKITSGYRCVSHNEDLIKRGYKAAKNSFHLKGMAVDIYCIGEEQTRLAELARKLGFGGIGFGKSFVHIDLGDTRPAWRY
jgi:zinc D-Ala-D-Ala carboxypeptidase